jgi:hypothetical protein
MGASKTPSSCPVTPPSLAPRLPSCTINTCTPGTASPHRSYPAKTLASHHTLEGPLAKELGIEWNLSTAYHPQTDGLSERANQWLKQFLRLTAANQEDWSTALPIATLVHNNSKNSTIKALPNQLLIGREPPATPSQGEGTDNPIAEQRVRQLRERCILITQALNRVANQ